MNDRGKVMQGWEARGWQSGVDLEQLDFCLFCCFLICGVWASFHRRIWQ